MADELEGVAGDQRQRGVIGRIEHVHVFRVQVLMEEASRGWRDRVLVDAFAGVVESLE